ncbi:hypothetical protein [Pseudoalteromonas arctica]|uniref:Uncharacterized protein n=1 Tax=Pseudoalteromonas arctica TaxID=394751 RepID=A0A7Y0DWE6_9GAMM|nr:hypothetical protein [Pseudoalteromonas arctica]NMM42768.1 hypothetical protein [Pseudoalteromonas arctica]
MTTMQIKTFEKLYNSGKLIFDGKYLASRSVSEHDFFSWFPESEFKSSEFDSSNCEGTVDVEDVDFIFESYHSFVCAVDSNNYQSDKVFIMNEEFVEVGQFSKSYLNWLELFRLASDHHYKSEPPKNERTVLVVDGSGASEALKIEFEAYSTDEIKDLIGNISDPTPLLDSCKQKDAHQNEKLSVLRTSIIKWLKKNPDSKLSILCSSLEVLKIFQLNYETYLRSFSFDEFIKDLEDDVSEFINKVEEQVQGFYLQALAVPGAVILASASRVAEKSINLALVFSTLLALFLVFRSLKTKVKFISRITENTKFKLEVYQRRVDDILNIYAKESISEKLESSLTQIDKLNIESRTEIENVRDIIIAIFSTYVIVAMVFNY